MQSFVYISVISTINLQGEGMVVLRQKSMSLVILTAETQLPGSVRKRGLAMGSLQALLQKVKRLPLQTATTWEAGRKTCVGF